MNKVTRVAIIVWAIATLTACGGGSGSSATPLSTSTTTPTSTTTTTTATTTTTTRSFVVGVTFNAETPAGLKLKLERQNGSEILNVPARSIAVTFASKLLDGENYTLSVVTQPFGLDRRCDTSGAY